ncbi:hypothetical protein ACCO45_002019 [Purpureocillium lilacinum]|uniref:Uncharacterized protein n=1 Tax=Purpureocillium lilacinum TaxID=33203 RepID=A0ACC4EB90_PURLI
MRAWLALLFCCLALCSTGLAWDPWRPWRFSFWGSKDKNEPPEEAACETFIGYGVCSTPARMCFVTTRQEVRNRWSWPKTQQKVNMTDIQGTSCNWGSMCTKDENKCEVYYDAALDDRMARCS